MSDRSDSSATLHEIDVTYERLRGSLLLNLPPEARRDLADKAIGIIRPLWQRLAAAFQQRIDDDRAANSAQRTLDLTTRSSIEANLFTGTLQELLPAARKLAETQTLAENIQRGQGLTTRVVPQTNRAAIDSGLQALTAGRFLEALQTWATADEPDTVVRVIQAQRQTLAAELIEQANMACDVIKELESLRLRYEARDSVLKKALEPIERIGTEKQRDQARWVYDELDVLLAQNPAQKPSASKPTPSPAAKQPRRTLWFALLALAVVIIGVLVLFIFTRPGNDGDQGQPGQATTAAQTQSTAVPAATVERVALAATTVAVENGGSGVEPTAPPDEPTTPAPEVTEPPAATAAAVEPTEVPATMATAAIPAETPAAASAETVTAISVTTAEPDAPPLPGRIAFTSRRNGNQDIFIMNAAGGEQFNVTQNPARDFSAAWSPDGSQLVFVSDREGTEQLFIVNADGTGLRRLTSEAGRKSTPSWSPDGANIIFQRDEDIFLARVRTGTLIRLSQNNVADTTPAWCNNGERVLYSSFRTGDFEIFYTDTMGSAFTRLTNDPGSDRFAVCSPDGTTIAFLSNRDRRQRIYLMNTDGTNQRPLDLALPDIRRIAWSPDGRDLVFDAYDSQTSSIYVVGIDGTGLRQMTQSTFDLEPAWGP